MTDRIVAEVGDRPWVDVAALALLALGTARRFEVMPHLHNWREKLGEAFNVARAFAETGTIADVFARGQGPTPI